MNTCIVISWHYNDLIKGTSPPPGFIQIQTLSFNFKVYIIEILIKVWYSTVAPNLNNN